MENDASNKQPDYVPVGRRSFIITSVSGIAATTLAATPFNLFLTQTSKVKAIAFDAFAIFDPRPVFAFAESIFSDKGKELSKSWRTKQFEYSWLRTAANQYKDFWGITE